MRGVTVTLYVKTGTSETDAFGAPIYTETPTAVENVLIGEPTTDDITTSTDLYGKRLSCVLGIPKGDTHDWRDARIEWTDAYGTTHKLRSFGFPITGVAALVPTPWHMKVRCEEIE